MITPPKYFINEARALLIAEADEHITAESDVERVMHEMFFWGLVLLRERAGRRQQKRARAIATPEDADKDASK